MSVGAGGEENKGRRGGEGGRGHLEQLVVRAIPAPSHQQLVHTVVVCCPQQHVWKPTMHVDVDRSKGLRRFPTTT